MATITGNLKTIGMRALDGLSPVLEFYPSSNALGGESVYAGKPETSTPAVFTGAFVAYLRATQSVRTPADFHYKLRIKYLDPTFFGPDAGMSIIEFPDWKIYVPEEGGNLADFIVNTGAADNPLVLWSGAAPPLAYTTNTWWFNPTDSSLKKWSA